MEEDELISGLLDAGHEVVSIGDVGRLCKYLLYWKDHCDIVFNRSVGYRWQDRKILGAAVLEAEGIPYVGSPPYALALSRQKDHAKNAVRQAGLTTPPSLVWPGAREEELQGLPYPALVKPVAESSSIGIEASASRVSGPAEAIRRAEWIVERYSQPALIETFVPGLEIEVPLLFDPEPRALGCVALTLDGSIVAGDRFLANADVYSDGYGFADPPPGVDLERITRDACRAAQVLSMQDYGRIDFRVTPDGTPHFLEASTHPHLQRHSSFFFLAGKRGLSYSSMLQEILAAALLRRGYAASPQNSMSQNAQGWR